jgi:hypothetical protein
LLINDEQRTEKRSVCANRPLTAAKEGCHGAGRRARAWCCWPKGVREPPRAWPDAPGSRKPQTMSGPSRSRLGLAPTCSTRRLPWAPR